ncbi:MAG TPA: GNAT family N-acetyltransferase [Candidatus Binatia bacterium]|jgi:ribosomal protein S18 acetylase RimI-like enzyme|nr:GNAT family N-acetyltransferase [Candidatus Binatia bacterium]
MSQVILRRFAENDRERIREIARNTGYKGEPTRAFFEDEEVIPRLFADYYIDYEPESCFVAEVDGKIVGYVLGCKDTKRYYRVLLWKLVPGLIVRILWKIATLQYRRKTTYVTLWIAMRAWREMPRFSLVQHPAHVHINVDARYRGGSVGKKLARAMLTHLKDMEVKGVHGIVIESDEDGRMTRVAQDLYGFRLVTARELSGLEKLTHKKWYVKVVAKDL